MRLLSKRANCLQLLLRVYEAFVAAGNVVVNFDTEDAILLRAAHNLLGIIVAQPISADPNVVGPVLLCGILGSSQNWSEQDETNIAPQARLTLCAARLHGRGRPRLHCGNLEFKADPELPVARRAA